MPIDAGNFAKGYNESAHTGKSRKKSGETDRDVRMPHLDGAWKSFAESECGKINLELHRHDKGTVSNGLGTNPTAFKAHPDLQMNRLYEDHTRWEKYLPDDLKQVIDMEECVPQKKFFQSTKDWQPIDLAIKEIIADSRRPTTCRTISCSP